MAYRAAHNRHNPIRMRPVNIEDMHLARSARSALALLAAALAVRDAGQRELGFMLLIYGCFSTDTESPSWQRFGQGAGLSQTQMRWIWETYLERPEQRDDWRASPIVANKTIAFSKSASVRRLSS